MVLAEQIRIRFANSEDLSWCTKNDRSIREEILRRKIEQNEIIVTELEGEEVGYLRFEYLWSEIPFISLIFVQEKYRRRGIGRAILSFLERFLIDGGYKTLLSSSQINEGQAQAWHRAVGFEECGFLAGINEGGIGEVFFHKSLA